MCIILDTEKYDHRNIYFNIFINKSLIHLNLTY